MWLVEIKRDGIGIFFIFRLEIPAIRRTTGNVLSKIGYLLSLSILPRIGVSPMFVEALLNSLHLFPNGCLGISLHSRINGGIDTKAISIKVKFVYGIVSRHISLGTKGIDVDFESLSEVWSHSILIAFCGTNLHGNGQRKQGVKLCWRCFLTIKEYVMVVIDELQDCISPL